MYLLQINFICQASLNAESLFDLWAVVIIYLAPVFCHGNQDFPRFFSKSLTVNLIMTLILVVIRCITICELNTFSRFFLANPPKWERFNIFLQLKYGFSQTARLSIQEPQFLCHCWLFGCGGNMQHFYQHVQTHSHGTCRRSTIYIFNTKRYFLQSQIDHCSEMPVHVGVSAEKNTTPAPAHGPGIWHHSWILLSFFWCPSSGSDRTPSDISFFPF